MAGDFQFLNMAAFQAGFRNKAAKSKKPAAEILNRAGGSVCANAIKNTPAADPSVIRAQLASNGLVFRLLQSPGFQDRLPRKLAGKAFAKRSRAQLDADAARLIRLRARSVNNIRAGFFKALAVFRPSQKRKVSDKGLAGQGTARQATPSQLVATLENHAAGSVKIAGPALQDALDREGKFMQDYGPKTIIKAIR